MNSGQRPWHRLLVETLIDNPEFVKIYVIPGLLFFLDFILRAVLEVDLVDLGADMALLAVATFVSLLVEDVDNRQSYTPMAVVFTIVFLAFWIISLKIISIKDPVTISLLGYLDFRLVLSWLVGSVAFVVSGVMAKSVIERLSDTNG
jgi:hypothetical protein